MAETTEHVDVLIIGAGLSGIGAAAHLVRECPDKKYAVLEAREAIGGTWDLFRYPGIRSDSDMFTFGYSFKPWKDAKAISDGAAIRRYVEETADEYGVTRHIRFGHRVLSASWSTADGRWKVTAERTDTAQTVVFTASWVMGATGYYSYDEGYRPSFDGEQDFAGEVIHPQDWPEDLDYSGRRIAVIGSGATAVTLVPNLAETAEHVTMVRAHPDIHRIRARRGFRSESASSHSARFSLVFDSALEEHAESAVAVLHESQKAEPGAVQDPQGDDSTPARRFRRRYSLQSAL